MSILKDAIDLHVHATPDVINRKLDVVELAERTRKAGMRGVLIKSHEIPTAGLAWILRKVVEGVGIFGSLTLNLQCTGGINPEAVKTAVKLGAKEIWMPTKSSSHHLMHEGKHEYGIKIVGSGGKLLEEVEEVLSIIADAEIILGTGHLSIDESVCLIDAARSVGIKKILVTHPDSSIINMSVETQKELSKKKEVFMEHCYFPVTKLGGSIPIGKIAKNVKAVGAEKCVLASDLGQVGNPYPDEGLTQFAEEMIREGLPENEVKKMIVENPKKLLGLK
jgi:hypothetical protein